MFRIMLFAESLQINVFFNKRVYLKNSKNLFDIKKNII